MCLASYNETEREHAHNEHLRWLSQLKASEIGTFSKIWLCGIIAIAIHCFPIFSVSHPFTLNIPPDNKNCLTIIIFWDSNNVIFILFRLSGFMRSSTPSKLQCLIWILAYRYLHRTVACIRVYATSFSRLAWTPINFKNYFIPDNLSHSCTNLAYFISQSMYYLFGMRDIETYTYGPVKVSLPILLSLFFCYSPLSQFPFHC